jgi:hypothetical protein
MPEIQIVTPLEAEEIKSAIITTICEGLWESLNRTGDLYQVNYPKFRANWTIEGELDNHGTIIPFRVEGSMPFTPPNVLRRKTGLPIPVLAEKAGGEYEQKAVIFQKTKESRYIDD